MMVKNNIVLFMLFLIAAINCQLAFAAPNKIYLLRHSEKQTGKNPHLTEQGNKRAESLILLFKDYKTVAVFSSDYNRTLETAAPVSKHFNTHINVYDASDLMAFKSKLLSLEGTVIVVGHSNTTPALAELLSNKKVTPMTEVDFRRYFLLDKSLGNKTDGYNVNELTMRF